MFEVIIYRDQNGKSEVVDYLDELGKNANTDKKDRINRQKILAYLQVLSQYGTRMGQPYVKHIEDDIWELRPLRNRIFFFYWKDNKFVILHCFTKKTQKTPAKEIERAKRNRKDFLKRGGMNDEEN